MICIDPSSAKYNSVDKYSSKLVLFQNVDFNQTCLTYFGFLHSPIIIIIRPLLIAPFLNADVGITRLTFYPYLTYFTPLMLSLEESDCADETSISCICTYLDVASCFRGYHFFLIYAFRRIIENSR